MLGHIHFCVIVHCPEPVRLNYLIFKWEHAAIDIEAVGWVTNWKHILEFCYLEFFYKTHSY